MKQEKIDQTLEELTLLALKLDSYIKVLHKSLTFDAQTNDVCSDYLDFVEDMRKQMLLLNEQIEELKQVSFKKSFSSFPSAVLLFPTEEEK